MHLMRAHAPAATSAGLASEALDADLELRSDLGFDLIALAELALAIEDAFGIAIAMADLAGCRTVRDLQALLAARSIWVAERPRRPRPRFDTSIGRML
jgi:acyl carrier protein